MNFELEKGWTDLMGRNYQCLVKCTNMRYSIGSTVADQPNEIDATLRVQNCAETMHTIEDYLRLFLYWCSLTVLFAIGILQSISPLNKPC